MTILLFVLVFVLKIERPRSNQDPKLKPHTLEFICNSQVRLKIEQMKIVTNKDIRFAEIYGYIEMEWHKLWTYCKYGSHTILVWKHVKKLRIPSD